MIQSLSLTRDWKKCLKLLDEMKIIALPTTLAPSAVAEAAFLNNEEELAWRLLIEILGKFEKIKLVVQLEFQKQTL